MVEILVKTDGGVDLALFEINKMIDDSVKKQREYRKDMISGKIVLPENMSYWFPKLEVAKEEDVSRVKLPKTMFKHLDNDFIENYLDQQHLLPEDQHKFDYMNNYMKDFVGDFAIGMDLFMKNGIFSNKFNFPDCHVTNRNNIGRQLYSINYSATLFGVPTTTEVVFREFIPTDQNVARIYNGMPLNAEFRVFYDFDQKDVIGVSNYWHPDVMLNGLYGEDRFVYIKEMNRIADSYNKHKNMVCNEVDKFLSNVEGIKGKWSVDIMMSDIGELWLIDMGRMNLSALADKMEIV